MFSLTSRPSKFPRRPGAEQAPAATQALYWAAVTSCSSMAKASTVTSCYRELTEGAEGEPHHEGAALDVDERGWLEPGLGVLDRRLGLRGGLSRGGCRSSSRRAARGREDAKQHDRGEPQGGVDVRWSEHGVSIVQRAKGGVDGSWGCGRGVGRCAPMNS